MSTTARDKARKITEAVDSLLNPFSRTTVEQEHLIIDSATAYASVLSALTEERIRRSIRSVLCDVANYPEPARYHLLGRDLGALINKATAAVLALIEQETTK